MAEFDVTIDQEIPYFDPELSYEITGYKPITDKKGLDFQVDEFIEVGQNKKLTGLYTKYAFGTKGYGDFWNTQLDRCKNGFTNSQGYTITGDHYFFLNFFPIKSPIESDEYEFKFPAFMDMQYRWFHYLEMAKKLELDACAVKTRGCGFSEIGGSLGARLFVTERMKNVMYTAFSESYLRGDAILDKFEGCINFLNAHTDRGMRRLLHKKNTKFEIICARKEMSNGQPVFKGRFNSMIGRVADNPDKLRGARQELLIFEEAGSFQHLKNTYVKGKALVTRNGIRTGVRVLFGTGGSKGPQAAGLEYLYYNTNEGTILGYRHNNTSSGNYIISGFFIGAQEVNLKYLDSRGYTNRAKAKEAEEKERAKFKGEEERRDHCAEYPFCAEEAFSLKNVNNFNADKLANQKIRLEVQKVLGPRYMKRGRLEYIYDLDELENGKKIIKGVKFLEDSTGQIFIAEHPYTVGGKVPGKLYIGGVDPIDIGKEDSAEGSRGSDFCMLIKQRTHRGGAGQKYVAYYKARPNKIQEANDNALKLSLYYNATVNVERAKMSSMLSHFRHLKESRRIAACPRALLTGASKERPDAKGSPSSQNAISHGLGLVQDYIENHSEGLLLVPLIEQLLTYNYNQKRLFDFVAAMQMCELLEEDMISVVPDTSLIKKNEFKDFGYFIDQNGVKQFGMVDKKTRINNKYFNLHSR